MSTWRSDQAQATHAPRWSAQGRISETRKFPPRYHTSWQIARSDRSASCGVLNVPLRPDRYTQSYTRSVLVARTQSPAFDALANAHADGLPTVQISLEE